MSNSEWQSQCTLCLNSGPSLELFKISKRVYLQAHGAFFTSPELAQRITQTLGVSLTSDSVYFDPTCGAGDLLLAVSGSLPILGSLEETLTLWGNRLSGCDTAEEFVRATKARLALHAMRRCKSRERIEADNLHNLFPLIRQDDAFVLEDLYSHADKLIMNPPFYPTDSPENCMWTKGKVNAAAVILETAVKRVKRGTRIVAILPDVLRSGSRYYRWREMITELTNIEQVWSYGLFDNQVDVDVFVLSLTVGEKRSNIGKIDWLQDCEHKEKEAVSFYFDVHVGSVVPHRHKQTGKQYRYIHARSLPAWGKKHRIEEKRLFEGSVFTPPFVAVRRTSSPSDSKRATATIVLGRGKVAVENHLLVCLPKDSSLRSCEELIKRLRSPRTDEWLNHRIRCRHLTVSAVAEIPWWGDL